MFHGVKKTLFSSPALAQPMSLCPSCYRTSPLGGSTSPEFASHAEQELRVTVFTNEKTGDPQLLNQGCLPPPHVIVAHGWNPRGAHRGLRKLSPLAGMLILPSHPAISPCFMGWILYSPSLKILPFPISPRFSQKWAFVPFPPPS